MNVEIGNDAAQVLWEYCICFEFSVQCICSAMNKYNAVIITIVQEVILLNHWKMGHRTVVVVYKDD